MFTHTIPGPPPGAGVLPEVEPEDPELLLEDFELMAPPVLAAAAGAAAAGAAAGALADMEPEELLLASLFTPPCPRHAPRPLFVDVVPSLHVVVPEPEEEDPEDDPVLDELLVEPDAGALLLEELPPAPALAVLSTPP